MRRVRYHAHGGPGVLAIEDAAIPEPGPGQVLIRTEAIGINYVDVQLRRETSADSIWFRQLPGTLTGDVVGTVEKAGRGADPALAGTRVAVLHEDAFADDVPAAPPLPHPSWLVTVPGDLGAGAASMVPTVGAVALGALRTGRLAPGETVLVTAGAGAIGHLAVQLARRQGAGTVISIASAAKLGFLKERAGHLATDHTGPDWPARVRHPAPAGLDLVVEAVGGAVLHQSVGL